jgi:hypothetical protein
LLLLKLRLELLLEIRCLLERKIRRPRARIPGLSGVIRGGITVVLVRIVEMRMLGKDAMLGGVKGG